MANEEIIIDIAENGDVRIEGKNFTGPECEKVTAAIEEALGTVTSKRHKPEFHRQPEVKRKAGA